ncbi:MAG: flagellar basal body rod protein FlgB [Spirochaetaceae bacterium]|nr:MAG: flagellar basal body rod protein FlgB [Spirochaetaceae bacterium]
MFVNNNFGRTVDILHRTMDVSLLRQDVIANNIANADTPNFKRSVVNFETALGDALRSEQTQPRLQAALTNERHIPFHRPVDYRSVRPSRFLDHLTSSKNNDNNVDIEVESAELLTNQLLYTLMTNSLNSQFEAVNSVLRG